MWSNYQVSFNVKAPWPFWTSSTYVRFDVPKVVNKKIPVIWDAA